jgi:metal-responsive CopG/Arc/MetJ family transcriptional regulator
MASIVVTISLHEATLKDLDAKRGDIPRSKFVQRLIEKELYEKQ